MSELECCETLRKHVAQTLEMMEWTPQFKITERDADNKAVSLEWTLLPPRLAWLRMRNCTRALETLALILHMRNLNSRTTQGDCCICMQDDTLAEFVTLPCGHTFHRECLEAQIAHNLKSKLVTRCALCRGRFSAGTEQDNRLRQVCRTWLSEFFMKK